MFVTNLPIKCKGFPVKNIKVIIQTVGNLTLEQQTYKHYISTKLVIDMEVKLSIFIIEKP